MRLATDRHTFFATAGSQIKLFHKQQQGLFEVLDAYQANLKELLLQEAKYGIAVPLLLKTSFLITEEEY